MVDLVDRGREPSEDENCDCAVLAKDVEMEKELGAIPRSYLPLF